MLVVNSFEGYRDNPIFKFLPKKIRRLMYFADWNELEEIRLRRGLPVILQYRAGTFFLNERGRCTALADKPVCATGQDMEEALELVSRSSLYAHENDIKNGYITIDGGCRVGISGTGVQNGGGLCSIKEISGLNYRIAHEAEHCADMLSEIVCEGGRALSTLIISPPECGKTTLLRGIIRTLSERRIKVSLVDERGEVAAASNGIPGFYLGEFCDVMTNVAKADGMLMMLRSMSPQVIATDELGGGEDAAAVREIINSGVSVLATVHGENESSLRKRSDMAGIMDFFDCFIVLSRRLGAGTVEEAYRVG